MLPKWSLCPTRRAPAQPTGTGTVQVFRRKDNHCRPVPQRAKIRNCAKLELNSEIPNCVSSSLVLRRMASLKNCTAIAFSLTARLLAICLTILSPDGLAQRQMVLVTTGSTMPEPLYVLWGDEYHKSHPETQLRYLAVGTSESANRVLSGTGGDLGGGDAPIPEKQVKEAKHAVVELPTGVVGI